MVRRFLLLINTEQETAIYSHYKLVEFFLLSTQYIKGTKAMINSRQKISAYESQIRIASQVHDNMMYW